MLSRIYIQCFENNKEAEKVEVNYERLKNPKKMFWPNFLSKPFAFSYKLANQTQKYFEFGLLGPKPIF
jgi:hypothetical protein